MTLDPRTIAELERLAGLGSTSFGEAEYIVGLLPDLLRERRKLLTMVADLHSRIAGDMLALGNDELAEKHEATAAEWRAKAEDEA